MMIPYLCNTRLLLVVYLAAMAFPYVSGAVVTLDGSLGPAGQLPGSNFQIPASVGKQVGSNLFHSFATFNLNNRQSATFTDSGALGPIHNILSRVTGGQPSIIDGQLGTHFVNDTPNLFFINPAGVIFGPNASLNVQGSLHVSTADYLRLGDGVQFDVRPSAKDALLTTAPVEKFGFINHNSIGIAIHGSQLLVPESKTLSVIGGNVDITSNGLLAGGHVNIASVASKHEVTFRNADLRVDSFSQSGNINIHTGIVAGDSVFIQGGQLFVKNSALIAAKNRIEIKSNALELQNNSSIHVFGGNVSIHTDLLKMTGNADGTSITTVNPGTHSGNINIHAQDILLQGDGVGLFTGTDSELELGNGSAGDIGIYTNTLSLQDGAQINTSTFGASAGTGGNITINAQHILLQGFLSGLYASAGGGLRSREPLVNSEANGGNGGNITINTQTLKLSDDAVINASTFGIGKGGAILINTNNLDIGFGAITGIQSVTTGTGDGGDININAQDILINTHHNSSPTDFFARFITKDIHGAGARKVVTDGAAITSGTFSSGKGGDVRISADNLQLDNGGAITTASNLAAVTGDLASEGKSGNIFITARNNFHLLNQSNISVRSAKTSAGNISIRGGNLLQLNSSNITTSVAGGNGNGGNIFIDPTFTILKNGSRIIANAKDGSGGKIDINSNYLFRSPDAIIRASSEGGHQGIITIKSPDSNITNSILKLPTIIHSVKIDERCAHRAGKFGNSSFKQGYRKDLYSIPGISHLPLFSKESTFRSDIASDHEKQRHVHHLGDNTRKTQRLTDTSRDDCR